MKRFFGWALVALGVAACDGEATVEGSGSPAAGTGGASSTGSAAGGMGGGGATATTCFDDHHYPLQPDYAQFSPVIGSHCQGTNHQDITGVEKLVFLGDSITQGTPPTSSSEFYRTVLADQLGQTFSMLEVAECADNGARVDDLLASQIPSCFPGPEPLRTLVVITMGGNDIVEWPQNDYTQDQATADADAIAAEMRSAIEWFGDPQRFPAGVFVIFANVYEYTDGTGELDSCPTAGLIGLGGDYQVGAPALAHLSEQYMKIAVDTGTDMIFMLEQFCGHGYRRDNEMSSCYLGPDAEAWFDITCIHPTPAGHAALANMFAQVVTE
jgi:lysophospholipase L1-like esterase